uniref:Uncharacterized protein n=1 Tax=Arundo donax TaxID=35708 RepID=A0A0A9EJH6_ARUDO
MSTNDANQMGVTSPLLLRVPSIITASTTVITSFNEKRGKHKRTNQTKTEGKKMSCCHNRP